MPPRIPSPPPRGQQSLLDLFLPQLQTWVENIPILGDIIEAITGREDSDPNDIGSQINKLKSWVGGLFGFRTSIASRVSAIEGKIATGAEFFDDFNRGDADVLGNGWTQGGDGQPLGIRDQAAAIIQGGIIAQAGRRWAKSKQAASGDTFTVSMVTHPVAPSRYAQTWLMARMNADFTEGLAVRMVSGKCWISRVSRSSPTSNSWNLVDVATNTAKSYSQSATVEFKGEETVLQVIIDSVIVLSATDTVHAIDASHRENGFAEQTTTQALGTFPEYSGALASYSLKSVAALQSVSVTAQTVATATVAPVASAVTAGSTGAAQPVDADPVVYAATKAVSDATATALQQSTTTAIQLQQQTQTQNAGKGVNKVLTFSGTGPLSSTDWTANTLLTQSSSQMALSGAASDGLYLARANYQFATDDQAVTFKLGDNANNDQFTYIILRASADGRTGVALRISASSLSIGTIAFGNDGDTVSGFSTAQSVSRTQRSSDNGEFRAVGTSFVVLINGNAALSYSGALGSVGSSWRNAAVIKQRQTLTFVYYSFNLSSFGMYDFGVVGSAITNRIGARITRVSTSPVNFSLGNGSTALVPSNFYSATDFAQGMTITDITTGKVRADIDNWYEFSCGLGARYGGDLGDFWGQAFWSLMVTPSGSSSGVIVSPALTVGESFKWALAAGDLAQPVVANVMSRVVKDATGGRDGTFGASGPATINQLAGAPGAFFQAIADI